MSAFFGLNEEDKEYYWEQLFALVYYCGFSFSDAYNLAVPMRIWFIKRLQKELSQEGADQRRNENSQELRALMGSQHPVAPQKLKRL